MGRASRGKADKTPRADAPATASVGRPWIGAALAFAVGVGASALALRPASSPPVARAGDGTRPAPAATAAAAARSVDVQQRLDRARATMEAQDLTEAQAQLEALSALAPNDGEIAFLLGDVAYRGLQMEAAEREFRRATVLAPRSAGAFANLALVLLEEGQAGPAADAARQALALDPGDARVQAVLGQSLLRQGRTQEAAELLEAAIRSGLRGAERQASLARARDLLGRREEALEAFDEALRQDPKLPLVHYWRADCLRRAGRGPEAEKELALYRECQDHFARLVQVEMRARANPKDLRIWLELARLRLERGLPSQAMAAAERARELAPSDAEAARVAALVEHAAATTRDVEP